MLLRDCIRSIKLTFNKEFDEVFKLKEAEIKRIKVCRGGAGVSHLILYNQCIFSRVSSNAQLSALWLTICII